MVLDLWIHGLSTMAPQVTVGNVSGIDSINLRPEIKRNILNWKFMEEYDLV